MLPDGTKEQDYEACLRWKARRWAWEFLKRNEKFRAACEEVRAVEGAAEVAAAENVAGTFGLKEFKYWASTYKSQKPKFVGFVTSYPSLKKFTERNSEQSHGIVRVRIPTNSTNVLIKFDLLPVNLASDTALKAQIKSAAKQLKKYESALQAISSPGQQKKQAQDSHQLIRYLRAFDLSLSGHDDSSICVILNGKSRDRGSRESERKAGEELRSSAEKWVQTDYLLLPILKIKKP